MLQTLVLQTPCAECALVLAAAETPDLGDPEYDLPATKRDYTEVVVIDYSSSDDEVASKRSRVDMK